MITADALATRVADFLGTNTEASATKEGRVAVLTPAEYPDCEGVVVYVEQLSGGDYVVSDLAGADSLMIGHITERRMRRPASEIADRFDVAFQSGRMMATTADDGLAETCWRVAQASAAAAEALTFMSPERAAERRFTEIVVDEFTRRRVDVQIDYELAGASGHRHHASLFVPSTDTVLEPIAGRKSWDAATKAYAKFGDLSQVNGYRLFAVIDDRGTKLTEEANLLRQVGNVARWSRSNVWLELVTQPRTLEA